MDSEPEIEKKEAPLADFRLKVKEAHSLLTQIYLLNTDAYDALYEKLMVNLPNEWRAAGLSVNKSRFFHAFIGSTTSWEKSPDLDLRDGLVSRHLNDVVLPTLKAKLQELQNPAK